MRIVYFTILSILIHLAVLAIPIDLTIASNIGNSDIANEFTDRKVGRMNVTSWSAPARIYTQAELKQPILDFMSQENDDLLLEETCEVPCK